MRSFGGVFVAALAALATSGLAQAAPGSVGDFRLPTEDVQPPPDRQGPVAADVIESQVRPTPAATPAPDPVEAAPRIVVPPVTVEPPPPQPTPRAAPTQMGDSAAGDGTVASQASPTPLPEASLPVVTSTPESAAVPPSTASVAEWSGPSWWWVGLGFLGASIVAFGAWAWRGRSRASHGRVDAPRIERPRLDANSAGDARPPAATEAPARDEPLEIVLEPVRLSLTLMNATLSYRLAIANLGTAAIVDLGIGADMMSAHASLSREEHLSGPASGARPLHRIARIEPGGRQVVEGEFKVPFSRIVPIRQGNAALLLPLARFRVQAAGGRAVTRSFVVGQPGSSPSGGLQPFRLDLGPRVYPRLAQRAFA